MDHCSPCSLFYRLSLSGLPPLPSSLQSFMREKVRRWERSQNGSGQLLQSKLPGLVRRGGILSLLDRWQQVIDTNGADILQRELASSSEQIKRKFLKKTRKISCQPSILDSTDVRYGQSKAYQPLNRNKWDRMFVSIFESTFAFKEESSDISTDLCSKIPLNQVRVVENWKHRTRFRICVEEILIEQKQIWIRNVWSWEFLFHAASCTNMKNKVASWTSTIKGRTSPGKEKQKRVLTGSSLSMPPKRFRPVSISYPTPSLEFYRVKYFD